MTILKFIKVGLIVGMVILILLFLAFCASSHNVPKETYFKNSIAIVIDIILILLVNFLIKKYNSKR